MLEISHLFLLLPLVLFFCIAILLFWRWKKFSTRKHKILQKIPHHLQKIKMLPNSQKILEYDKVLDQCLYANGYTGTLGNKMKKYGKNFVHQNNIWTAHKLRNRIAHEIGFEPSAQECLNAENFFLREIRKFL